MLLCHEDALLDELVIVPVHPVVDYPIDPELFESLDGVLVILLICPSEDDLLVPLDHLQLTRVPHHGLGHRRESQQTCKKTPLIYYYKITVSIVLIS